MDYEPKPNYSDVASLAHRKRFGQFLTPPAVAALMADWVVNGEDLHVLDPALGTGVLAAACMSKAGSTKITAFEIDDKILQFLPATLAADITVIQGDFLQASLTPGFDGVIMNPPYIRHREVPVKEPARSQISAAAGCIIPVTANLYLYFMLKAINLTRSGGRIAFLVPSEWMSANFSANFKEYLLDRKLIQHLVTFSHCSNVFDDALTTASLLLLEIPRT